MLTAEQARQISDASDPVKAAVGVFLLRVREAAENGEYSAFVRYDGQPDFTTFITEQMRLLGYVVEWSNDRNYAEIVW